MKKIIQILKNNSAYLAMKKGKGEIVVSHASDEAILIASAFFACPKTMLVIKDSLYQAQLLYQELYPLLHQKVAFFPCDESLRNPSIPYKTCQRLHISKIYLRHISAVVFKSLPHHEPLERLPSPFLLKK